MGVISGTLGRFYSHGTVRTAFTYEECAVLSRYNWQISDTTKRWWPPESPVTVYTVATDGASTVAADSSLYTLRSLGGVVEFIAEPAGTVQVSGTFYPMLQVGGFRQWEVNFSRPALDSTQQGVAWEEAVPAVAGFSLTADGFWKDSYFFSTVDPSVKWIAVAYVDYDAGKRYEAETYLTSNVVTTSAKSLVEEKVEFKCTGTPQYYDNNS